ncbi:hypothetical protein OS121_22480 [Mycolicibacterium mucogenicum]|uniref:hypothetical protein n=1 Tax=Mycolicibacterium mucogenicum TaxID=56689 RepID=UPI002269A232|nr:hypothetical protein [Mycolicibacterium mucogenicum]MCX8557821.1 hypothetical protein [Mycolicibacterium mucogenicum]
MAAGDTDSDVFGRSMVELLRTLAAEPEPPVMPVPEAPDLDQRWAAERAQTAFEWALRAAIAADNAASLDRWSSRREQLRSWMVDLGAAAPIDIEAVDWSGDKSVDELTAALHGVASTMLSELEAFYRDGGRSAEARRDKVHQLGAAFDQVGVIIGRLQRRRNELLAEAELRIGELADGDYAALEVVNRESYERLSAASATAARHIDTHTRRVLDVDDGTAALTVTQWYERCGVDYRADKTG